MFTRQVPLIYFHISLSVVLRVFFYHTFGVDNVTFINRSGNERALDKKKRFSAIYSCMYAHTWKGIVGRLSWEISRGDVTFLEATLDKFRESFGMNLSSFMVSYCFWCKSTYNLLRTHSHVISDSGRSELYGCSILVGFYKNELLCNWLIYRGSYRNWWELRILKLLRSRRGRDN